MTNDFLWPDCKFCEGSGMAFETKSGVHRPKSARKQPWWFVVMAVGMKAWKPVWCPKCEGT